MIVPLLSGTFFVTWNSSTHPSLIKYVRLRRISCCESPCDDFSSRLTTLILTAAPDLSDIALFALLLRS